MSNYQNGTIYKIVCKDSEITDCYVGSTTSHSKRKSKHKYCCNNEKSEKYNLPVYRFIRDNGGWENWNFVLLEDYPCRTKKQLNIRERYWFEKINAILNDRYPERGKDEYQKQYYDENKEKISGYKREYRDKNKEQISEYHKKWYEENIEKQKEKVECPCGSIVRKDGLTRHKKSQKHQEWEKTQVE